MSTQPRSLAAVPRADLALERPMYLGLRSPVHLDAADEDALRIVVGEHEQRVPMVRLSRIVLGVHATWTPRALRLCLSHGVSLSILDERGEPLGHAWGQRVRQAGRASLLAWAQEDPEWPKHYREWYQHCERVQVTRALLGLGVELRHGSVETARSQLASHYRIRHGEAPGVLFRALDAILQTRVNELLGRAGWFDRVDPACARALLLDFQRLLTPALERGLADQPGMRGRTLERARDLAWLASFVEQHETTRHDFEVLNHMLEDELRKRYG
ncbi:MAG: CRISPR-associated endonuclease Cas1 [Casimicrobiaceae bacterium]|nr:CRISPR-associated endonuclease Cas1 [Casimicrobiaceae bacterium]MDW8313266.1 CRISPR-associated endonuclease Cas1 [Burkholderiales bacterium]